MKNNKLKVMMIGPLPPPFGGIGTLTKDLLTSNIKEKIDLTHVTTVSGRDKGKAGNFSISNLIIVLKQYLIFLLIIFQKRPAIVHIHTSQDRGFIKDTFYVIFSKLNGCKIVLHIHAFSFEKFYLKWNPLIKLYIRKILKITDKVIVLSESWRNCFKKITDDRKITVFQNCINVEKYQKNGRWEKEKKTKKGIRGLFVGSIDKRKGIIDLFKAISIISKRYNDIHFDFIGVSPWKDEQAEIKEVYERYKIDNFCTFYGALYGQKKIDFFLKTDIFILPSHDEGLPIAILEAMAAGLPIISTAVGGIPEIVEDGINGFIISKNNPELLAKKIYTLCLNPSLREKISRNNIEKIKKYNIKDYVDRLVKEYRVL